MPERIGADIHGFGAKKNDNKGCAGRARRLCRPKGLNGCQGRTGVLIIQHLCAPHDVIPAKAGIHYLQNVLMDTTRSLAWPASVGMIFS